MKKSALLSAISASVLFSSLAHAYLWEAVPITVHEWGVHEFDAGKGTPGKPELPGFIHTDVNPGVPVPAPAKRMKDMPPDSGIRKKPVLYFYLPKEAMGENAIGVELRFAFGHANAWYPQANVYRTPAVTANATAPDWAAWQKVSGSRFMPGNQTNPAPLPVPDDLRMELVWSRLMLSTALPEGAKLQEVPADHWINSARDVKSAYVSNGTEAEKFLFYEGATSEKPAVAVIPDLEFRSAPERPIHAVNISDAPIYDVFAIYHHDHHSWIGYVPALEPLKQVTPDQTGGAGITLNVLTIPDFANFQDWTDEKTLPALTTDRLINCLTAADALTINHVMRDPADPQGPTQAGRLFPDEARALEKIWHEDFFAADGLTLVYRESPAALDKAMPLNLYTDMYHYVSLSRCGMAVVKNIDVKQVDAIYAGTLNYTSQKPEQQAATLQMLKQNCLMAENMMTYQERTGKDVTQFAAVRAAMDGK